MPAPVKHNAAAARYAQAMLELAGEQQAAEPIGQQLQQIEEIIQAVPTLALFLRDPGIAEAERRGLLEQTFRPHVHPLIMNLLGVLSAKHRLALLPAIAEAYDDLLNQQLGRIEVDVTLAHKIDPESLEQIRQRINRVFKKDAVVHPYVDESIIGGMVVRIEDKLLDASVKSQLEAIKRKMMSAAPA